MTALSAEATLALRSLAQNPHRLAETPRPLVAEIARSWLAYRRTIGGHDGPPGAKVPRPDPDMVALFSSQNAAHLIAQTMTVKDMKHFIVGDSYDETLLREATEARYGRLQKKMKYLLKRTAIADKSDAIFSSLKSSTDPQSILDFLDNFWMIFDEGLKKVDHFTFDHMKKFLDGERENSEEINLRIQENINIRLAMTIEPIPYSPQHIDDLLNGKHVQFYLVNLFIFETNKNAGEALSIFFNKYETDKSQTCIFAVGKKFDFGLFDKFSGGVFTNRVVIAGPKKLTSPDELGVPAYIFQKDNKGQDSEIIFQFSSLHDVFSQSVDKDRVDQIPRGIRSDIFHMEALINNEQMLKYGDQQILWTLFIKCRNTPLTYKFNKYASVDEAFQNFLPTLTYWKNTTSLFYDSAETYTNRCTIF